MRLFRPLPQATEQEWMDEPGHPRWLIEDNLKDLRRVNRVLGGTRLTLDALARLTREMPQPEETLRVLDVASGASDIPRAIARWASRHGRRCLVLATDFSFETLRAGRDHESVPPGVLFVVADATALPFRRQTFHVAASSLALHHMLPEQAEVMLREQRRCTRLGVILNDVVRTWLVYGASIVITRLVSRNRLTLHDGPLSVRRAFTVPEMRQLAGRAGLRPAALDSFLFYRVALTALPV